MNQYVTGAVIKELREKNNVTQLQLADKLGVSDKTISKWETEKDIRILLYWSQSQMLFLYLYQNYFPVTQ